MKSQDNYINNLVDLSLLKTYQQFPSSHMNFFCRKLWAPLLLAKHVSQIREAFCKSYGPAKF